MNAPTLVPTLPVTLVEAPALLNAPIAVKTAKLDEVPRSGACAFCVVEINKLNNKGKNKVFIKWNFRERVKSEIYKNAKAHSCITYSL